MDSTVVRKWAVWGNHWIPTCVDTVCPYCDHVTALAAEDPVLSASTESIIMLGRCVRCGQNTKIWVTQIRTNKQSEGGNVLVFPSSLARREMAISEDVLPARIFNAYKEAVNCFNGGHWRATVTECGRALEAVTKDKFPKQGRNLYSSLEGVKQDLAQEPHAALFEPIIQLGHALRLGRNTSAHFDPERDPDRQIAEEVLELAEYLLKYFYVLPSKTTDLEAKINALGTSSDEDEP